MRQRRVGFRGKQPPKAYDRKKAAELRAKREAVFEAVVAGATYQQVGNELGIARKTVQRYVAWVHNQRETEMLARSRTRFNAYYDRLRRRGERIMETWLPRAAENDPKAAMVVIRQGVELRKINEAQAALNGAQAPQQIELAGKVESTVRVEATQARAVMRQLFGEVTPTHVNGVNGAHAPAPQNGTSAG